MRELGGGGVQMWRCVFLPASTGVAPHPPPPHNSLEGEGGGAVCGVGQRQTPQRLRTNEHNKGVIFLCISSSLSFSFLKCHFTQKVTRDPKSLRHAFAPRVVQFAAASLTSSRLYTLLLLMLSLTLCRPSFVFCSSRASKNAECAGHPTRTMYPPSFGGGRAEARTRPRPRERGVGGRGRRERVRPQRGRKGLS